MESIFLFYITTGSNKLLILQQGASRRMVLLKKPGVATFRKLTAKKN